MPSSAWSSDVCSRSEEHTSELQSLTNLVCRLLLETKHQVRAIAHPVGHTIGLRQFARCVVLHRRQHDIGFAAQHLRADFVFFNDTAPTEIYTLSLHDALPI